jgi:hypothetical protein
MTQTFRVRVDGTVFLIRAVSIFHAFKIAWATYPLAVVVTDAE